MLLILLVLAGFYLYYNMYSTIIPAKNKNAKPVQQEDVLKDRQTDLPTSFIGILRPSGLLQDQKQMMHLSPGEQIVVTQPFNINGNTYNFAYLGAMIANSKYPSDAYSNGKCVWVQGIIDPLSVNDTQTYYEQSTLGGVVLPEATIQPEDFEKCRDAISTVVKPMQDGLESLEISGVIRSLDRPAPDIAYDYLIESTSAISGVLDMSGLSNEKTSVVVVPANFDIYKIIEETLGKPVRVKGYLQWGYAESQSFTVEELKTQ